jgi:hypothetical protein
MVYLHTNPEESFILFIRLSVSNDLKYDAQRDLYDIGAQFIEVHALNKVYTRVYVFSLMFII